MAGTSSLEAVLWDAIAALASAIDGRNHTTGHSLRVADYAVRIAEALGWDEPVLKEIRLGALLHDIGQVCWSEAVLQKQGELLTGEDREMIESHTYKGVDLIRAWPSLHFIEPYILYHQEWVDGSGYPYGLQGDSIPLAVQVVSLADVYEALSNPRMYMHRPAYSSQEALTIMSKMRGKRWNADLFDRFANLVRDW
ncbi:MAG TPA: HD domain-containing phosphohydrolase [Ktedonobacteraceae bacterium]|nr:HD domain-containing phosphohydrolase [Ktedonobacteraceae bacterium]